MTTNARTCIFNVKYQFIWGIKYKKPILNTEMIAYLKKDLKEIGSLKNFDIKNVDINSNVVICDVSAHPKYSPSYIAKMLKGISGRHLLIEFPELGKKPWNDSFFVETKGFGTTEGDKYIQRMDRCKM